MLNASAMAELVDFDAHLLENGQPGVAERHGLVIGANVFAAAQALTSAARNRR